MSAYSAAAVAPLGSGAAASERTAIIAAGWLVVAATVFNFLLAFVNSSIFPVGSKEVIGVEALIIACCHLLIVWRFRSEVIPWYVLLWVLAMIAMARWLWLGHVDPKTYRDVLIIPSFICLGLVVGERGLNSTVLWIQGAVLAIALIEILFPSWFSALINVKQYYVNTRGFDESAFWNSDSDLFVSATRPQERSFFPGLNLHRVSSVFLEPVSLGNYCTIITAFVCARFSTLSWRAFIFLVSSNLVLLVACDGRLAVNASFLIIIVSLVAHRLPYVSVLFLPIAVTAAFIIHHLVGSAGEDNFPGRVALTAEMVGEMSFADFMGVRRGDLGRAADSGFAYLIITQSIVGTALLWLALNLMCGERNSSQAKLKHGLLIYLSLTMVVSYSFLSIKTAALAWFMLGAVQGTRSTSTRSGVEKTIAGG